MATDFVMQLHGHGAERVHNTTWGQAAFQLVYGGYETLQGEFAGYITGGAPAKAVRDTCNEAPRRFRERLGPAITLVAKQLTPDGRHIFVSATNNTGIADDENRQLHSRSLHERNARLDAAESYQAPDNNRLTGNRMSMPCVPAEGAEQTGASKLNANIRR